MPSILIIISLILIGIFLTNSISQLFLYLYIKKDPIHVLLGMLGISASLYLFYSMEIHSISDIETIGDRFPAHISLYLLEIFLLLLIVYFYSEKRHKFLFFGCSGIISITFILNLIMEHGVIYRKITAVKKIDISLIEEYYIVKGEVNGFYEILALLFYLLVTSYLLAILSHFIREGKVQKVLIFSILSLVYVGVNVYDVMVDLEYVEGVYLSEFSIMTMILLFNIDIAIELRNKAIVELKLKRVTENFDDLIENVQLIVLGLDLKGKINYVNPYFLNLVQYKKEEVIGKEYMPLFIPEEIRQELYNVFNEFLAGKDFSKYQNPILTKSKKELQVSWSNVLVKSENGDNDSLLCVGADITEKLKAKEELIQAYHEIESIKHQLEDENTYLKESLFPALKKDQVLIGMCDAMQYVKRSIQEVAISDSTVLIEGETGVGKEVVAQSIFKNSLRTNKPFIKVNCGALPKDLIESELFGHEKGAFTGAASHRKGRFELADGGTLFLDEIGELPLELQPKLLRVLQSGEIMRLGSEQIKIVDVRIIAATNRDLKQFYKQGMFREDLFYRLSVFPITVPPLRERKEDIPELVHHFVGKYCEKNRKEMLRINMSIIKKLQKYSWPGNIRELSNVLERAVLISKGDKLVVRDKLEESSGTVKVASSLEEIERSHITSILEECNWKVSGKNGAATLLELNEATLRSKMKRLGISRPNIGTSII